MLRLLAAPVVLAFLLSARADEVRESLAAAAMKYEQEVASIQADMVTYFDQKIAERQQRGDLDKTLELQALKDTFVSKGMLPDVLSIRSYRQKVKRHFTQATRDYRVAHVRAIEAYTRGQDLRAAQQVKASLEEFDASQEEAVIRFPPSEDRKREDGDKNEPKQQRQVPVDMPPLQGNQDADPPARKILDAPAMQEFVVDRPVVIQDDVEGSLRVVAGGNLTLRAVCEGDLIVEQGGVAVITGIVSGNVLNLGGDLHFTGIIAGQLLRKGGRTVVAPKSVIGGVRQ